jgi:hypothetical protein
MPISLQCPGCRQVLTVADQMAGQQAQCSACRTMFIVPGGYAAPVAAATGGAPFTFGAPAGPAPKGGLNFQAAPQDQSYKEVAENKSGWKGVAAGLKHVWLGSAIQALGIAFLIVVRVAQAALAGGLGTEGVLAEPEKKQAVEVLGWFNNSTVLGVVTVVLLAGAVVRLLGYLRCVLVPAALPMVLGAANLLGEAGVLLGSIAFLISGHRSPSETLIGQSGIQIGAGLGVVLLLLFVHQVGAALDSRSMQRRAINFAIWIFVGPAIMLGTLYGTAALRSFMGRDGGALGPSLGWGTLVFNLGMMVGVPILMLFKYLGVVSLGAREVRRRVVQS